MLLAGKRHGCFAPRTSCRNSRVSLVPIVRESTPVTPGVMAARYSSTAPFRLLSRFDRILARLLPSRLSSSPGSGACRSRIASGIQVVEAHPG